MGKDKTGQSDVMKANQTFTAEVNGQHMIVTEGQTARKGHPILKGRGSMFDPFTVDFEVDEAVGRLSEATAPPPSGAPGA